jgi:hypothetical protein
MKELNDFTPFNHGYLCQMLRSASDNELADILNDVSKEQQRRVEANKNKYIKKIRDAIKEAIDNGYCVDFYYDNDENVPDFSVHSNNEFLYDIEIE